MTTREQRTLALVAVLYAAVVIPIGIHKGGDIVYEIGQAERLLRGAALYEQPPPQGAWWPPFATAFVVPFALLARTSLALAKGCWAALGVAGLVVSVVLARRWGWPAVVLALAAVALPLQNTFEHLNINTVLLALILAAAVDLSGGREGRAGAWLGLATALKAFPGLLLVYLVYRRAWRGAAVGAALAGGLTYAALLRYGVGGGAQAVWDWFTLSARARSFSGQPMQKLARLVYDLALPPLATGVLVVACLALLVTALRHRPPNDDTPYEVGAVTLVAVLIAPIGWLHSFTLAFPAWIAAIRGPVVADRRLWRGALLLAGVLTSGVLGHHFYPAALAFIAANNDTLGSLLLLVLLVLQRVAVRSTPTPTPAPAPAGPC
ncbi:MAG TPA: glycosyltransferase family 87 protein [Gemmatimonadales bacterium]|nr:glycosyltransferase family 87 protein [Gemmatimonadales bacterium]